MNRATRDDLKSLHSNGLDILCQLQNMLGSHVHDGNPLSQNDVGCIITVPLRDLRDAELALSRNLLGIQHLIDLHTPDGSDSESAKETVLKTATR